MESQNGQFWFFVGCAVEGGLLALAGIVALFTGDSLFSGVRWTIDALAWGTLATLPALLLFAVTMSAQRGPFREVRFFLESRIRPLFQEWNLAQIAVIAALAGVSEEVLFRVIIQGNLQEWFGAPTALVLAGLIFGCFHMMTWGYALLAALLGFYLGAIWLATGNLLVPILAHGLYDFVALVYFLRFHDTAQDLDR